MNQLSKVNRYCTKCEGKIVLHAFSEGECIICNKIISTGHIPCDKVCDECSIKLNKCKSCGK